MANGINYTGDLPRYVLDRLFDNLTNTSRLFDNLTNTSRLFDNLTNTSRLFDNLTNTSRLFDNLTNTSYNCCIVGSIPVCHYMGLQPCRLAWNHFAYSLTEMLTIGTMSICFEIITRGTKSKFQLTIGVFSIVFAMSVLRKLQNSWIHWRCNTNCDINGE